MREKGRLLLVSGPYIDRALLERVFGEEYDIRTTEVEQALELLLARKEGYSAMLLDCCKAEEQRMDLLRAIRREPTLADLPVVVAVPGAEAATRALRLGAADCVAVPVVRRFCGCGSTTPWKSASWRQALLFRACGRPCRWRIAIR